MDADFIVLRDLTPVIQRLEDHDLISYATQSNPGPATRVKGEMVKY